MGTKGTKNPRDGSLSKLCSAKCLRVVTRCAQTDNTTSSAIHRFLLAKLRSCSQIPNPESIWLYWFIKVSSLSCNTRSMRCRFSLINKTAPHRPRSSTGTAPHAAPLTRTKSARGDSRGGRARGDGGPVMPRAQPVKASNFLRYVL